MIARFLQRLTLIAFTAHAVLGCCWHHSHVIGEEGCHQRVHRVEVDAGADCCAHLPDQRSGPATVDSDQRSGPATVGSDQRTCPATMGSDQAAERTPLSFLALGECPCEHSHECDEACCHYVPRNANSANGFLSVSVADLAPTNVDLFALSRIRVRRVDADRAFGLPVESSRQRCANLQSWQI